MATASSVIKNGVDRGDSVMSYEDQEKINLFACRNAQLTELKQEVEDKKKELQSIEDASDELMLSEEDDSQPVLYLT
ncbi:Prefoldin subunit 4 [Trichoplax sp. H2]|nr:Prefoldin subunit 4 [Trichoplax sp. H2]|eukprot:RDD47124.1 Prefoldin subunit 4 [Trichoplax sp. H2]